MALLLGLTEPMVNVDAVHQQKRELTILHSVQVRLDDGEIGVWLSEMRKWLDGNGFEPDAFEYRRRDAGGVVCRVDFKLPTDAVAFADAFQGYVVG